MTDPENVLARWSRRKRDIHASERKGNTPFHGRDDTPVGSDTALPAASPPSVDLTKLPSLESIVAETDLCAFLDQRIPAEITRAALRRGWSVDPAIRDFIGLSENSWDFNAADGIPGFGSLASEEIQRLLAQMIEGSGATLDPEPTAVTLSPSNQSAPQVTEHPAPSEMPPDASAKDLSLASDQIAQTAHANSEQSVSTDLHTDTAQSTFDIHRPSRQHRHGGAKPY